jgi:trans-AT polyketide synthase/acyltransferase/oxidoreductase domain-containing protein
MRTAAAAPLDESALASALANLRQAFILDARTGKVTPTDDEGPVVIRPGLHYSPAVRVEDLGEPSFRADHRLRFAYVAGAMANGVGSADIVEAMGSAGMMAFFGAAGLSLQRIDAAIDRITRRLGPATEQEGAPFGFNLIHSPNEPAHEAAVVDLFLRRGVRLIEASAYLDLTLPVVRYRVHGIHRDPHGRIVTPNRMLAKVSRVEVASKFFAPPPLPLLRALVESHDITAEQAEMAAQVPMAQDVTAEADSAGHTDNRPALALVPTLLALRDRFQSQYGYLEPLRVGAAGGIATPASAAAAFAMGAAYVLTGSINQACVESGSSDAVRHMLAEAAQADVAMAPAADMFEMGVKVQVLKRGTMFAMRAARLYEIFKSRDGLDAIPSGERELLEDTIFRERLENVWEETRSFWRKRDPGQLERAEREPKHKMALVFRWYLGMASRWANSGDPGRKADYQVWCGPAMGAFNEWAKGSALERPADRHVVTVALNILYGAAVLVRANAIRCQGIWVSPEALRVRPVTLDTLQFRLYAAQERS